MASGLLMRMNDPAVAALSAVADSPLGVPVPNLSSTLDLSY